MTFGTSEIMIRNATADDLHSVKALADSFRHELGFVQRQALLTSVSRGEIFVALDSEDIVGFVEYYHRKDEQTTIYHIAVEPSRQRQGIGRILLEAVRKEAQQQHKHTILVKCPFDLPANQFYERIGYQFIAEEKGKKRTLCVWQITLQ